MQDSLGKITCVTPGQPVRSTINKGTDADEAFVVHGYSFQWLDTNQGKAYVSLSETDDRGGLTKILCILSATCPGWSVSITMEQNGINMSHVFIDFDNAGDAVIGSVITQ